MKQTLASLRRAALVSCVLPAAWLIVFYVFPLGNIFSRALSIDSFADILGNFGIRHVLWFTMWQALLSTALTLIVAFPITWACSRWQFTGQRFVIGLATAPFVLPTVIVAAAVRATLPEQMSSGITGIMFAHVIFNLAVVVRIVSARWQQAHPNTAAAARTLGASSWKTFWLVTWPMIRSAVVGAAGIVFMFCFTSFGVIKILGGPRYSTIEVEIFTRAVQFGDINTAVALVLLQLIVIAIVLGLTAPRDEFGKKYAFIVSRTSVTTHAREDWS